MPHVEVLTIGAAVQDCFLRSNQFEEKMNRFAPDGLDACVPLGSKIQLEDLETLVGGGATNAAVTFSRFGLKTACIARIGKDATGDDIIAELKKNKVDVSGLQVDADSKTGRSIILISGSGHRAIFTYRGAAAHVATRRVTWTDFAPSWIYLTSLGGDLDKVHGVFAAASRLSARVAWNPGGLELEHGKRKLAPFLKQTDVLILNREEAALLAQKPPRDLRGIFKTLSPTTGIALTVTDGQQGAYLHADRVTLFAPALKAKRVNTTGAGDAFGSAFVASLARKRSLPQSLQAAMLNATGVVTHMGAHAGILSHLPAPKDLRTVTVRVMPRL